MPKVTTNLTDEELVNWKNFCSAQGKSSAEMLRSFVRETLQKEGGVLGIKRGDDAPDTERLSKQINLKFSEKQAQKIQEMTAKNGYEKVTQWVRFIVMNVLNKQPILTHQEIISLRESTYALTAIGRNLNQIARQINTDFRESDKLKLDMIMSLKKMIEMHKKQMTSLVNKSFKRMEN